MPKYLFIALLLLSACFSHKEIVVDPDKPKFDMQESNRLFFRNVRSAYYDREALAEAKIEVFSNKPADSLPDFCVKLVLHQVAGRAFAMLEPAGGLPDTVSIHWKDTVTQASGIYRFEAKFTPPDQFGFATKLYGSIQRKHVLEVRTASGAVPLWPTAESREPFRKVMVDFYRLVGIL